MSQHHPYFLMIFLPYAYTPTPRSREGGPGGVSGTTPVVVALGVEHAGDRVRLPGP